MKVYVVMKDNIGTMIDSVYLNRVEALKRALSMGIVLDPSIPNLIEIEVKDVPDQGDL